MDEKIIAKIVVTRLSSLSLYASYSSQTSTIIILFYDTAINKIKKNICEFLELTIRGSGMAIQSGLLQQDKQNRIKSPSEIYFILKGRVFSV